jgi:hypothetical protein
LRPILGHDTGLGKGLASYIWPVLKVGLLRNARRLCPAEPVLMVAAGDLHNQIISEGLLHFGTAPMVIDKDTFLKLSTINPQAITNNRRLLKPGYYLTTYTDLSSNGITPFPDRETFSAKYIDAKQVAAFYAERGARYPKLYARLEVTPDDSLTTVKSHWFRLCKQANGAMRAELDYAFYTIKEFIDYNSGATEDLTRRCAAILHTASAHNIGTTKHYPKTNLTIKCVYSPSMADLAQETFAAMVCDEAVKIKGEDTIVGIGTRQMNPRYRLAMTATPIKNRLPDIFHLAHWSTGAHHLPSPRFPFGIDGHQTFAEEFSVSERNLSKEEQSEGNRRFVKLTPQVCNIHRLWKLMALKACQRKACSQSRPK